MSTVVSQVVPPPVESWLASLAAASRGPLLVVPWVSQYSTLMGSPDETPKVLRSMDSSLKPVPVFQPRTPGPATWESQVPPASFQTRRSCQPLSTFTYMM